MLGRVLVCRRVVGELGQVPSIRVGQESEQLLCLEEIFHGVHENRFNFGSDVG